MSATTRAETLLAEHGAGMIEHPGVTLLAHLRELDVFRHNENLADRYAGGMRALLARGAEQLSASARAAWRLD